MTKMNKNPLAVNFRGAVQAFEGRYTPIFFPYVKKYLIVCFTPRSGSSWLTDLVQRLGLLGGAGEYLNPQFVPKIFERYPATSLPDYVNRVLKGTATSNGVASIEVTWFHLKNYASAIGLKPFANKLPKPFDADAYYVWLRRRDFVAQAVSLYRATKTGVFHSTERVPDSGRPKVVEFDAAEIKSWVEHILQQEYGFERWFAANNLKPLRIFYEDTTASSEFTLKSLLSFVDEPAPDELRAIESAHRKLADEHSLSLIERFNREQAEFVAYWRQYRGVRSPEA